MNRCYICQAEAVSRCYNCGELICEQHGHENCERCDSAVMAGETYSARVSSAPLRRRDSRHAWWRPQEAEEYLPPACYACKALARAVCRNCGSHYCREHAGHGMLCAECRRSARLGLVIFVVAIGSLFALVVLSRMIPW
jgi:hypothetical protein